MADAISCTHQQGVPMATAQGPLSSDTFLTTHPNPYSEPPCQTGVTVGCRVMESDVYSKHEGVRGIFGKLSSLGLAFKLCSSSPHFYGIPILLGLQPAFQLTHPLGSQHALH